MDQIHLDKLIEILCYSHISCYKSIGEMIFTCDTRFGDLHLEFESNSLLSLIDEVHKTLLKKCLLLSE